MITLLENYTILYVEDEAKIREEMEEYLSGYFKSVYCASDGKEGLAYYYQHQPDAVLVDIDMPGMNGLELIEMIRNEDRTLPVMILTAYTDTEKLLWAAELKLLKYLVKPIDPQLFGETLESLAKELMASNPDQVCLGEGYRWDKQLQRLYHKTFPLSLTPKEKLLLQLLIKERHKSVMFEDIMVHLWADEIEKEVSINSVKNIVSDLRKKLPKESIKSIYGKGYMLQ